MQLEGAIVSRPMPWTSLCYSELHRCIPVFLPVGQPGAPASSTSLPAWFVTGQKDVVTLLPVYSRVSGKSVGGLLQCYNVFWYVLQRTAGPSGTMTSCNVLNSSAVCIRRTCFLNATVRQHGYCGKCNDSFGTQAFFACCSALRILPSTSLTETIQRMDASPL